MIFASVKSGSIIVSGCEYDAQPKTGIEPRWRIASIWLVGNGMNEHGVVLQYAQGSENSISDMRLPAIDSNWSAAVMSYGAVAPVRWGPMFAPQ